MIHRLRNSTGKDVWYNSETGIMTVIPIGTGYLSKNGVFYKVFESIEAFLSSGEKKSIIYAYCVSKTKKGKRFLYVLSSRFGNYEIFNGEYTSIGWLDHAIETMEEKKGYMVLVERNDKCVLDVHIKFIKEL